MIEARRQCDILVGLLHLADRATEGGEILGGE